MRSLDHIGAVKYEISVQPVETHISKTERNCEESLNYPLQSSVTLGKMAHSDNAPNLIPAHHQFPVVGECSPPPIGVFWDIENCGVPCRKSALAVVSKIRDRFFGGHREAEFMCVCDISKENREVIQELNYAQVTVVHINATSKNTADDKIRQALRRFAATHPAPATVILISGDINFAPELSDLRYRHHLHVVLIHRRQVTEALLTCAHEHYCFDEFIADVTARKADESPRGCVELLVSNLPPTLTFNSQQRVRIKTRLTQLGNNCGGRVVNVANNGQAIVRFPNKEATLRAKKRMEGEDVFGCKISVQFLDEFATSSLPSTTDSTACVQPVTSTGVSCTASSGSNGGMSLQGLGLTPAGTGGVRAMKPTRDVGDTTPKQKKDRLRTTSATRTSVVAGRSSSGQRESSASRHAQHMAGNSFRDLPASEMCSEFSLCHNDDDVIICGPVEEIDFDDGKPAVTVAVETLAKKPTADPSSQLGSEPVTKFAHELVSEPAHESVPKPAHEPACEPVLKPAKSSAVTAEREIKSKRKKKRQNTTSSNADIKPTTTAAETQQKSGTVTTSATTAVTTSSASLSTEPVAVAKTSSCNASSKLDPSLGPSHNTNTEPCPGPVTGRTESNLSAMDHGSLRHFDTVGAMSYRHPSHHFDSTGLHLRYDLFSTAGHDFDLRAANLRPQRSSMHHVPSLPSYSTMALEAASYPAGMLDTSYRSCESLNTSMSGSGLMLTPQSSSLRLYTPPGDGFSGNLSDSSRTPSFRRTPGARRPNGTASTEMPRSQSCQSFLRPRPLFAPPTAGPQQLHHSMSASFSRVPVFPDDRSNVSDGNFGHIPARGRFYPLPPGLPQPEQQCFRGDGGRGFSGSGQGVELVVSNLDYNITMQEWKKILHCEFQQQVQILNITMQMQSDNTSVGFVRVPSLEEARHTIAQFHRKKIGYKRIHVAIAPNSVTTTTAAAVGGTKLEVVSLLKEIPGHRLPLFQFIELFEKRFHRGVSVSEIYHMRDVIEITERDGAGRMVVLLPAGISPTLSAADDETLEQIESPVCRKHCRGPTVVGDGDCLVYREAMDMSNLPHVVVQLRTFSAHVHGLLQSHDGSLPLVSFPLCYADEFGALHPVLEGGVPLEHLITCVNGLEVSVSSGGIKKIHWAENRPVDTETGARQFCNSPLIGQQLSQFCHEVIDLLRHSPQCRMQFSKFIPAYHHHFGRQCRVADYGFTKLIELFDAVPHVAQVIGAGSRRYVALTHRAQVRRFTADLLRILKLQLNKQIGVVDLPAIYNNVTGRAFDITDYGLCFIEDMLGEILDSVLVVSGTGANVTISLPRRDQTAEELERMKQFSVEVVDLLRHSPQCRMQFSKFIPAYHHHFGRQCRVADYGFTKLIELFDAVPEIVRIVDDSEEKVLCLSENELLKFLEENVSALLRAQPSQRININDFLLTYITKFGNILRLDEYNIQSVNDLVARMPNIATIEIEANGQQMVRLVDDGLRVTLACNVLLLLMDKSDGSLTFHQLYTLHQQMFSAEITLDELRNSLQGFIQVVAVTDVVEEAVVKLCAVQMFARDARSLLLHHGGRLALSQFERSYSQFFGIVLTPASYGHASLVSLLQAVTLVLCVRGKTFHRRVVVLTPRFQEKLVMSSLSSNSTSSSSFVSMMADTEAELLNLQRTLSSDILCAPLPSNLPSPDLQPSPRRPPSCLMRFDSFINVPDFLVLSEEEKCGLKTPLCRTPVSELLQFAAQYLPTSIASNHTKQILSAQTQQLLAQFPSLLMAASFQPIAAAPDDTLTTTTIIPEIVTSLVAEKPESEVKSATDPDSPVYPPMPASAQHISIVQERILRGSSATEEPLSPARADVAADETTDDGDAFLPAVEPASSERMAAGTPTKSRSDIVGSVGSEVHPSPARKVYTPRRSRIAARFNLMPKTDVSQPATPHSAAGKSVLPLD